MTLRSLSSHAERRLHRLGRWRPSGHELDREYHRDCVGRCHLADQGGHCSELYLADYRQRRDSGTNTVTFQGRLSSAKTLKPGRYTVTATATGAAGQRSKPSSLSFTIVK
jgi:hypothetical protein